MPVHTIHCPECRFTLLYVTLGNKSTHKTNASDFLSACQHREELKSVGGGEEARDSGE